MLKLTGVTKKFKKLTAVDQVSFDIEAGEVVGILGPNGAGKSTTIKMIAGLLRTTEGTITIDGHDNKSIEAKKRFVYIPEFPELYEQLTVDEHFRFIAQAYNIKDWNEFITPYLERFDLLDKRSKSAKELSKGMKQKVSICCGLLSQGDLYLFDEPMIGLDPKAIRETKAIISELSNSGKTILVSTHLLDSIEHSCDRVLVMKEGKMIVNEKMADFKKNSDVSLEEVFLEVTQNA